MKLLGWTGKLLDWIADLSARRQLNRAIEATHESLSMMLLSGGVSTDAYNLCVEASDLLRAARAKLQVDVDYGDPEQARDARSLARVNARTKTHG